MQASVIIVYKCAMVPCLPNNPVCTHEMAVSMPHHTHITVNTLTPSRAYSLQVSKIWEMSGFRVRPASFPTTWQCQCPSPLADREPSATSAAQQHNKAESRCSRHNTSCLTGQHSPGERVFPEDERLPVTSDRSSPGLDRSVENNLPAQRAASLNQHRRSHSRLCKAPASDVNLVREHLISSQFFSKRNAFQIGFTPLPPPSIRKASRYRTFSDNNRCRLSSRPRLSTTKLLPAGLLSFSSREASADNIISTSSSFSHKFPVSLHASSALRLASFRGRPGLQAT